MDLLREKQRATGAHRAMGGGGAPDQSGQNFAAIGNYMLSREQLDWAKQIYADSAPDRASAVARANQVSDLNMAQTRQQMGIADQAQADYQTTYRPLEQQMVSEATAYDTPQKRAAESAAAVSSVEQQLQAQRQATMREQERAGVNPESGRTAALQGAMDIEAAKAKAGAGNMAQRNVEAVGYARKADAVNLGRGIQSAQGTAAQLALQQGNAAVTHASDALAVKNNGQAAVQGAYGTALQGGAQAGQMFGNIAQQQSAAQQRSSANTAAGVGAAATIAGATAGTYAVGGGGWLGALAGLFAS